MKKLGDEQIQFIDRYLDNSDVVYADIRMELVDHVATDIETSIKQGDRREFYDIFKDYMVANKAKLLNDNKQFLKSADKKILKAVLKELPKPFTICVFGLVFFGFYIAFNYLEFSSFRSLIFLLPLGAFILFGILYKIYSKYYGLERLSVIERLMFPMLLFYHLFSLVFNISHRTSSLSQTLWVIGVVSISLTFMFILIKISLDFAKIYHERFKKLA